MNDDNQPTGLGPSGFNADITIAPLGARSLAFELLVRSVTDYAILLLDLQGNVVSWNAGAEQCKGYRADEIIGKHFACFFSREDVDAGRPARQLELAASEGRYAEENWRLRKDGSRFWASISITALRDTGGKLVAFGKVVRDLTDRLRTNEQFRLAIEAAPTGMIMIDQRGEIVLVNAEIEKLFGYPLTIDRIFWLTDSRPLRPR